MKSLISFIAFLILVGLLPLFIFHCGNSPDDVSITDIEIRTTDGNLVDVDTSSVYFFDEVFKTIMFKEWEPLMSRFEFHSMNYAIATSPAEPSVAQEFQNISIVAVNDLTLDNPNQLFLAGSDITEKFLIKSYGFTTNFISIEDFLQTNEIFNINDVYIIRLATQPAEETTLIVNIQIQLDDGKTFVFDKEIIKVK